MKKGIKQKSTSTSTIGNPFFGNKEKPFFSTSLVSLKAKTNNVQRKGIAQHGDVRKDKEFWSPILNSRRQFLTKLIQHKSKKSFKHDFRFLIPLAHRLMEQGGFDKGNTELNNPYYLRSKGDEGYTELTKIEQGGKRKGKFGKFSTEEKGIEAYIDQLKKNKVEGKFTWRKAYDTIMEGGSFQDFIRGLQPDGNVAKKRNYSTKYTYDVPQDKKNTDLGKLGTMIGGMRTRLLYLIGDFIAINNYEINKLNKEIEDNEDPYDTIEQSDRINYLKEDNKILIELKKSIEREKEYKEDLKWKTAKGIKIQKNGNGEEHE